MSKNPVQYIDKCEDADLAGFTDSGWYFWEETWVHCNGPYESKNEAAKAYDKYYERLCPFITAT